MASIIGGVGAGTLDSSLYLLNRQDTTGTGTAGAGEAVYVNVANGGLVLQHADAWLPSQGEDFLLVRTYNSSGRLSTANKWSLAASLDVSGAQVTVSGSGKVILYNADGSDFTFTKKSGSLNTYVSVDGAGAYQTISYDSVAKTFTVTRSDQAKLTFNDSGVLTKSTDTNGVSITYTHTGNRLTSVQDDTGHTVTYGYTGNNLTSLTDGTGTVLVSYTYDSSNRLTSSTDRAGRTTVYRYDTNGMVSGVDLPTETDKLLINGGVAGAAALAGADSQYYLDWRKRLGVVDGNGNGKTASALTSTDITTLRSATTTSARSLSFEYTTVSKGTENDTKALSALIDAEGNRTEFSYTFTLSSNKYAGGTTTMVNALGLKRMKSNDTEYVNWRTTNGYYATWSQASYDAGGSFKTQADAIASSHATTYTFNASGAITSVKDASGLTTVYEYDTNENLTKIIDANADAITKLGIGDSIYYTELRKNLGYVDWTGTRAKTVAELDEDEVIELKARFTTTLGYDGAGNLTSRIDGEGNKTTYKYTSFNKLEAEIAAMGHALAELDTQAIRDKRIELGYPGPLSLLSDAQKDQLRALYTTTYLYDSKQNLTEIKSGSGALTKFSNFDAYGNAQTKTVYTDSTDLVTASKQLVTTYLFDAFGNNTSITESNGGVTTQTFDKFGNILTRTDARGGITTFTYDNANRLLTVTDAENNLTYNVYDAVGNRVSVTDANGHFIYSFFDKNNRLIKVNDPSATAKYLDRNMAWTYDVVGNNTSVTHADGWMTLYKYDALNRVVEVTPPATQDPDTGVFLALAEKYAYDAVGNRITVTNQRDHSTWFAYNGNNLLTHALDAVGNLTTYAYDANLNQVSIVIGAQLAANEQRKLQFRYDQANQRIAEIDAFGNATYCSYDDAGRKTSVVSAMYDAITKSDDIYYAEYRKALGIVTPGGAANLTDDDKNTLKAAFTTDFSYSVNTTGLLITETAPPVVVNGVTTRPVTKRQFDKAGNEISVTNGNNATTTFTFDKLNRVIMVSDGNTIKTVYSYDTRGNRVSVQIGVTASVNAITGKIDVTSTEGGNVATYQYNEFNQLTAVVDGVGNALVTSDSAFYQDLRKSLGIVQGGNGKTVAQLSESDKATLLAAYTTSYAYDYMGNRTRVTDHNGTVTDYVYDRRSRLIAMTENYGAPTARTTTYAYDPNGNRAKVTDAVGNTIVTAGPEQGDSAYYTDLRRRLGYTKIVSGVTVGKAVGDLSANEKKALLAKFTTTYKYDAMNRLTDVIDATGVTTKRIYDALGNMTSETRAHGTSKATTASYLYDLANHVVSMTDPTAATFSFQYDALGNRVRLTDGRNNSTWYGFDALSRNVKILDPLNGTTAFEYDAVGNRVKITDPRGHSTQFEFDPGNRLFQMTDAENRVTRYAFDNRGNTITQTTAYGTTEALETKFEYDAENHLTAVVDANGKRATSAYDGDYNRTAATDANGNSTSYAFDAFNRNIGVTDANGKTITYAFDANNNRITITDARNSVAQVTAFAYDTLNREVIYTDAEGNQTTCAYDALGNKISLTDPNNVTATFEYDANGRLTKQTDGLGNAVVYAYDKNGNLRRATDARGNITTYTYDANNRVSKITDDIGNVTQYKYDAAGNRTHVISPLGYAITTKDDADGVPGYYRALRKKWDPTLDKAASSLTPDEKTRLLGLYTAMSYFDKTGKVTHSVDAHGFVTKYEYDKNGNVKTQTLYANPVTMPVDATVVPAITADSANDQVVSFEYDNLNRVSERKDGEGFITKFVYDNVGNVTETHQALDIAATQWAIARQYYDKLGREIFRLSPEGYLTETQYDGVGNVTLEKRYDTKVAVPLSGSPAPLAGDTWRAETYQYDKNNRLIRAGRYQTASVAIYTEYAYDANGNVLSETQAAGTADAATVSYEYDDANRLVLTTDATGVMTFLDLDANGNVISRYEAYGTADQRRTIFDYNANNQQEWMLDARGIYTRATHDAAGNRIMHTQAYLSGDARAATFTYDRNGRLASATNALGETTQYGYDAAGNQTSVINANLAPLTTSDDQYYQDLRQQFGNDIATLTARCTTSYSYNRANRLVEETDTAGVKTQYTYSGAGNLLSQTRAVGVSGQERLTSYVYDKDNRLTSMTTPLATGINATVTHEYNAHGNVIKTTDADGGVITSTYDMLGRITATTDRVGNALATSDSALYIQMRKDLGYVQGGAGKTVAQLNGTEKNQLKALYTTQYTYDARDNVATVVDHDGTVTASTYDKSNRVTSVTEASGTTAARTTSTTYDAFGNQKSVTDAVGNALVTSGANFGDSVYYTDLRKRLGFTKIVGGVVVGKAVADLSDAEKTALKAKFTTTFEYDDQNNLHRIIDGMGVVTRRLHDSVGNVESETRGYGTAEASTTEYVYDLANRVTKIIDPTLAETSYEYDALGNRIKLTDGRGNSTRYFYDALSRNVKIIDPLNFETKFEYDAVGNRVKLTDARGNSTKFDFDLGNRLFQLTDAENRITRYAFDKRGNTITQTTAYGTTEAQETKFEYDAENHLTAVVDANAKRTSNTYDRDYNTTKVTDANGNVTSYGFDALNRNVSVTDANNKTVSYAFDANNNRITITDARNATAQVTTYAYDERNREVIHTDAEGNQTVYAYDALGNRIRIVNANAIPLTTSDDAYYRDLRRDLGITDTNGNGKLATSLNTSNKETLTAWCTTTLDYDGNGRLIKETNGLGHDTEYDYDAAGNRVRVTDARGNVTTYGYDANNRVVSITDGEGNVTQYGYDAVGNRNRVISPLGHALTTLDDATGVSGYYRELRKKWGIDKAAASLNDDDKTKLLGLYTSTSYFDKTNLVTHTVDAEGYVTKYEYDKNRNLKTETRYAEAVTMPVDVNVTPVPIADASRDQVVTYAYDRLNRVIERKDAEGFYTKFVYDNVGNVIETHVGVESGLASAKWAITRRYYDKLSRELFSISPEGYLTETQYDHVGNVTLRKVYDTKIAVPVSGNPAPVAGDTWHATVYRYDRTNRVTREGRYLTSTTPIYTDFTYDAVGNRLSETIAATTTDAVTTRYVYDGANRMTHVIDAAGTVTYLERDENGALKNRYDAYGTDAERVSKLRYDDANRVYRDIDANKTETRLYYDASGNVIRRTDAYNTADARTTNHAFDRNGRQISLTNAENETTQYTYDAFGNQTSVINANLAALLTLNDAPTSDGGTIKDYYKNARKVLGIGGGGKSASSLTNDDIQKLTERCTISYVFDRNNRVTKATDANGVVTQYTYDGLGNKKTTTQAVGVTAETRVTFYEYDKEGRVTKVTDPLLFVTMYEYDVLGNQTKITDAMGNVRKNTFDLLGRLLTTTYGADSNATSNRRITYTYDRRGNMLSATESYRNGSDARTTAYRYDLLNRQTRVTDAEGFSTTFEYDAFGNQTKVNVGLYLLRPGDSGYDAGKAARAATLTTTFAYDKVDRLDTMTDGVGNVTDYGYDRLGNRTHMTEAQNELFDTEARTTTYRYDLANRLIRIETPLDGITHYSYDDVGNKIRESVLQDRAPSFIVTADMTSWADVAEALYGVAAVDADNAGTQLAAYYGTDKPAVGTILDDLPTSLSYQMRVNKTVDPFYTVSFDETWESLAVELYGAEGDEDIAYVAGKLENHNGLDDVIPAGGQKMYGFPDEITRLSEPHYEVMEGDSLEDIFQKMYSVSNGTDETYEDALAQFESHMSGISLTPGTTIDKSEFLKSIRIDYTETVYEGQTDGRCFYLAGEDGTVHLPGEDDDNENDHYGVFDVDHEHNQSCEFPDPGERKDIPKTATYTLKDDFARTEIVWTRIPLPTSELTMEPATATLTGAEPVWINCTYEYDANRNLVTKIDSIGTRTEYAYDAVGNKTVERFAAGTSEERTLKHEYDLNNRKTADLDAYDKPTRYEYDKLGRRTKVTNALNQTARYYYDRWGNLTSVLDAAGYISTFIYDSAGNRLEERVYATKYTGSISDTSAPTPTPNAAADRTVTLAYDLNNRVVRRTDADGTITRTEYDGAGKKLKDTLYANLGATKQRTQQYHYDAAGRLDRFTDVDGTVTTFTYDGANNRTSETITVAAGSHDPNSVRQTIFEYDLNNRRTRELFKDANGTVLSDKAIGYDLVGNITSTSTGYFVQSFLHDSNGNVVQEVTGSGSDAVTVAYAYDRLNNRTSAVDALGHTTTYVYDLNNRLTHELKPLVDTYTIAGGDTAVRPTTVTVYDDAGRAVQTIVTVTSESGVTAEDGYKTTRYYDANDRLVAELKPDGGYCVYAYNAFGELITQTEYEQPLDASLHNPAASPAAPAGDRRVTTFEYDAAGRLLKTTLPPIKVTTLTKIDTDKPKAKTETLELTEIHRYDEYGDEVETVDRMGNTAFSYYDVNHRKIAAVDALGHFVEWKYDQQGNQIEQRLYATAFDLAKVDIDAATKPTPPNGTVYITTREYDAASRLVREKSPEIEVFDPWAGTASTVRPRVEYTYDGAGNVFSKTMAAGTNEAVTEYSFYDSANRVVAKVDGNLTLYTFKYDSRGNLTHRRHYFATVRLTLTPATTLEQLIQSVYNYPGDPYADYDPTKDQIIVSEYDAMNRLVKQSDMMAFTDVDTAKAVAGAGDLTQSFKYDAQGNRTSLTNEDGYETRSAYDAAARVTETINPEGVGSFFEYDVFGNVTSVYTGAVDIDESVFAAATAITTALDGDLAIGFTVSSGTKQSYVVWDTTSRASLEDYEEQTTIRSVGTSASSSATIDTPAVGTKIYFRVVSVDAAGNLAYTAERSVRVPPQLTSVAVAPSGTNLVVTATFDAAFDSDNLPTLSFGAAGTLALRRDFVHKSGNTYTATIPNFNPASMPAYRINWKDADGVTRQSAEAQFAAQSDRVGITSEASTSSSSTNGVTSYTFNVTTKVPSSVADTFDYFEAQWRSSKIEGPYIGAALASVGTAVSGLTPYSVVIGEDAPFTSGTYEIRLSGVRADGSRVVLDTFLKSVTSGTTTSQSVSWDLPPEGSDQIVLVDNLVTQSTRSGDRLLIDDALAVNTSKNYLVYYGTRMNEKTDSHTLSVSATPSGSNISVALQLMLSTNENANVDANGVRLAVNGLDLKFEGGAKGYSLTRAVPAGTYPIEIFYTDTSGRRVVIERRELTFATGVTTVTSYTGASLTVLATDTGTLARDSAGRYSVTPSLFTGTVDEGDWYHAQTLNVEDTEGSEKGILEVDGETAGYYVEYRYNDLNHKIASNENDGLWREFGVNQNGVIVKTTTFESVNGKKRDDADSIVTYTAVDARGRTIADFGPKVDAGTPVTRYTYDVLDRMLTKLDPGNSAGTEWEYAYNALGAKVKEINPNDETTITRVDQFGNVTAIEDGLGKRTLKFYDKAGNLIREIDAVGNTKTYTYDLFNRKIGETDGRGNVTHNNATRTISVNDGSYTTRYTYDRRDRLTSVEAAQVWHLLNRDDDVYRNERKRLGFAEIIKNDSFGFDPLDVANYTTQGKAWATLTASDKAMLTAYYTTQYTYDGRGNRLLTKIGGGAENQATRQVYDGMNRVTETGVGFAEDGTYTRTTKITSSTGAGVSTLAFTVTLTANDRSNMSTQSGQNGVFLRYRQGNGSYTTVALAADGNTFTHAASLPNGAYEIRIHYNDKNGQMVVLEERTISTADEEVIFTSQGFIASSSIEIGSREYRSYDAYGNLIGETSALKDEKTSVYGGFGRLLQTTDEDGNITGYEYDDFGRVIREYSIGNVDGVEGNSKNIERTWDDGGHLTQVNDTVTGVVTDYTYNLAGLRKTETLNNNNDAHERSVTYAYDASGRLTEWQEGAVEAQDASGRNASLAYTYDAAGNRRAVRSGTLWDPLDKNGGASPNPNYRYVNHQYRFHDNGAVQKVFDRVVNADGTHTDNVVAEYTYDAAGNRLTWKDSSGSSDVTWTYVFDANNRVVEATTTIDSLEKKQIWVYDTRGNVVKQYNYQKLWGEEKYTFVDGTVTTYDARDRATRATQYAGADLAMDSVSITSYDKAGRTATLVYEDWKTTGGSAYKASSYSYEYTYYKDGREASVEVFGRTHGASTSHYDGNLQRVRVDLGQGTGLEQPSYTAFTYDNEGHILSKFHESGDTTKEEGQEESDVVPDEFGDYFYANGNPIGEISGKTKVDGTQVSGNFFNTPVTGKEVLFDAPTADPKDGNAGYGLIPNIGANHPGSNARYTAQRGDTLQSIASLYYGNPSLWYVIADANGISGNTVPEGRSLKIPNTVQTGRLTHENHALYDESRITGSTLPSLTLPPPKAKDNCQTIAMIVIIVVIAVVAAVATAGAGAALAGVAVTALGASAGSVAAAAITIGAFVLAGAAIAGVASIMQQHVFMSFGAQKQFSWDKVGLDMAAGALTGAAGGFGEWAKVAAAAGKLANAGSSIAKGSAVALSVASNMVVQASRDNNGDGQPDGKFTSYAGVAGAALGSYFGVNGNVGASHATEIASPWVQLGEMHLRQNNPDPKSGGRVTPTNWADAAGASLAGVVSLTDSYIGPKVSDPTYLDTMGMRLRTGAMRLGANFVVAGAAHQADANARAHYIASSIGHEVGTFIGHGIAEGIPAAVEGVRDAQRRRDEVLARAQSRQRVAQIVAGSAVYEGDRPMSFSGASTGNPRFGSDQFAVRYGRRSSELTLDRDTLQEGMEWANDLRDEIKYGNALERAFNEVKSMQRAEMLAQNNDPLLSEYPELGGVVENALAPQWLGVPYRDPDEIPDLPAQMRSDLIRQHGRRRVDVPIITAAMDGKATQTDIDAWRETFVEVDKAYELRHPTPPTFFESVAGGIYDATIGAFVEEPLEGLADLGWSGAYMGAELLANIGNAVTTTGRNLIYGTMPGYELNEIQWKYGLQDWVPEPEIQSSAGHMGAAMANGDMDMMEGFLRLTPVVNTWFAVIDGVDMYDRGDMGGLIRMATGAIAGDALLGYGASTYLGARRSAPRLTTGGGEGFGGGGGGFGGGGGGFGGAGGFDGLPPLDQYGLPNVRNFRAVSGALAERYGVDAIVSPYGEMSITYKGMYPDVLDPLLPHMAENIAAAGIEVNSLRVVLKSETTENLLSSGGIDYRIFKKGEPSAMLRTPLGEFAAGLGLDDVSVRPVRVRSPDGHYGVETYTDPLVVTFTRPSPDGASPYVPRIDLADRFEYGRTSFLGSGLFGRVDKSKLSYRPADNHYMHGKVNSSGILTLSTKARGDRSQFGGGKDMFHGLMKRYEAEGVEIRGIRAVWERSTPHIESTNFDQYHAGLASGLTPQEAALNTFTGQRAKALGFGSPEAPRWQAMPGTNTPVLTVQFNRSPLLPSAPAMPLTTTMRLRPPTMPVPSATANAPRPRLALPPLELDFDGVFASRSTMPAPPPRLSLPPLELDWNDIDFSRTTYRVPPMDLGAPPFPTGLQDLYSAQGDQWGYELDWRKLDPDSDLDD